MAPCVAPHPAARLAAGPASTSAPYLSATRFSWRSAIRTRVNAGANSGGPGEKEEPRRLHSTPGLQGLGLKQQLKALKVAEQAKAPRSPAVKSKFTKKKKSEEELAAERAELAERARYRSREHLMSLLFGTDADQDAPVMVVDGYNVVMEDEYLRQMLARGDSAGAREALQSELSKFQLFRGIRLVLVWDALGGTSDTVTVDRVGASMQVVFAGDRSADSYIHQRVEDEFLAGTRLCVVVSSDQEVQMFSRHYDSKSGQGTAIRSSRELLHEMARAKIESERAIRSHNKGERARQQARGIGTGDLQSQLNRLRVGLAASEADAQRGSPSPFPGKRKAGKAGPAPQARAGLTLAGVRGTGSLSPRPLVLVSGDAVAGCMGLARGQLEVLLARWAEANDCVARAVFAAEEGGMSPRGRGAVSLSAGGGGGTSVTTKVLQSRHSARVDVAYTPAGPGGDLGEAGLASVVNRSLGEPAVSEVLCCFRTRRQARETGPAIFEHKAKVSTVEVEDLVAQLRLSEKAPLPGEGGGRGGPGRRRTRGGGGGKGGGSKRR